MARILLAILLILGGIASLLGALVVGYGSAIGSVTAPGQADLVPALVFAITGIAAICGGAAMIVTRRNHNAR